MKLYIILEKILVFCIPVYLCMRHLRSQKFALTPEHAEQVRINKVDSCTPLELQTTHRTEKMKSSGPSAVPTLSPRKFLTRRSSLWLFSAPPHTRTLQARTHNGAANLPDNKKFKTNAVLTNFV